ncbi:MAG: hypothetical protein AB7F59_12830 [Bdellovibrionales bacterium]
MIFFSVLTSLLLCSFSVEAAPRTDRLGEIKLTDFMLEPTWSSDSYTASRGFSEGRSYIGAMWSADRMISVKVSMGSRRLLIVPARLGNDDTTFGLVEAYAQADTNYGLVRAGLIPIFFGHEAGEYEYENLFPNSLLFQNRLLLRRDQGASYAMSYNDFNTFFAVHNGEAGVDVDDRYWVTGRWSYSGPAKSEMGVSGTTGRSVDRFTLVEEKIRAGNVFFGFNIYGLGLAAEGTMASHFVRNHFTKQTLAWHVDGSLPIWPAVDFQVRYDFLDPDHSVRTDTKKDLTMGFNWHNRYKTSTLFFLGSTQWIEGEAQNHNYGQVIWRLTPWSAD